MLDYSRNKQKTQETVRGETEEESFERQKLILKQILEELFEEFDCRLDHLYAGVKSLNNLKVLTCKDS